MIVTIQYMDSKTTAYCITGSLKDILDTVNPFNLASIKFSIFHTLKEIAFIKFSDQVKVIELQCYQLHATYISFL